jgi:hypothetical protein
MPINLSKRGADRRILIWRKAVGRKILHWNYHLNLQTTVEKDATRTDNIQTENYVQATYNRLESVESQQFRRPTIIPKRLPNAARDKEIPQPLATILNNLYHYFRSHYQNYHEQHDPYANTLPV